MTGCTTNLITLYICYHRFHYMTEKEITIQQIFQKAGNFSVSELQLLEAACVTLQLNKNDLLLKEGQVCDAAFYLLSGAAYQFRITDIDENIVDLHLKGEWFLNPSSFISRTASATTIKVFVPGEVLVLSVHTIHQLIEQSPAFLQLGKLLQPNDQRLQLFENAVSPAEKYKHILEDRPQLLQVFPLKMIASYLKMTPETLSRVRSNY